MSSLENPSSSSVSGGGNWRHRGGNRQRGMPKACRCGEEAVIRTSGTVKNPGRLFHCCPYGSEEDKYHLFKWTDESMVEEIKDLIVMLSDVKGDITNLRGEVVGLEKELEEMKKAIAKQERDRIDCINEVKSMKNVMVFGFGIAIVCYYFFG
ncbi:uncharacterized protein At4g04775-like [Raphanus sativus]|uniref:Uncharacterized protein At4g04775-like n=1 Tax=Raphanus sativus TaxID=3726 RepID=A0A6J0MRY4_RAPSA|nr:uncharacterized protein At4g04775-like [Raphanus sativus]